jgi:hypothetical protein
MEIGIGLPNPVPDTSGITRGYGGLQDLLQSRVRLDTDTVDSGEGELTMWRVPGYVGREPWQPVSRDVVAGMDPMSDDRFPDEVPPHWSLDFWVANADAIADRAAELGGKVIVPPIRHADLQDRCAGRPVGAEPP